MSEQTQEEFDFNEYIESELGDINWDNEAIEYIGNEVYLIPIEYLGLTIYIKHDTK